MLRTLESYLPQAAYQKGMRGPVRESSIDKAALDRIILLQKYELAIPKIRIWGEFW
jgi:hypothetical protein